MPALADPGPQDASPHRDWCWRRHGSGTPMPALADPGPQDASPHTRSTPCSTALRAARTVEAPPPPSPAHLRARQPVELHPPAFHRSKGEARAALAPLLPFCISLLGAERARGARAAITAEMDEDVELSMDRRCSRAHTERPPPSRPWLHPTSPHLHLSQIIKIL